MNTTFSCLLGLAAFGLLPGIQAEQACSQETLVRLPTSASSVTVVHALPEGRRGADIIGHPEFHTQMLPTRGGSVEVNVSPEPVWIVEGELPALGNVSVDSSPFGFHPALAPGTGFGYAEEIGVGWHRPGLYLMWVLGQPDVSNDHYVWDLFDRDVRGVPPGMRQMRNLRVCHDAMIQVPNRPLIEAVEKIAYWTYQRMTGLLQQWDGKPPERLPLGEAVVGYRFRMSNAAEGAILVPWLDQTAERMK